MSNNKKKNIHVLIQECTEHLRFLGYSEACITLHQKKWSEYLLTYLQEKDIVFYSTEAGECYLKSVLSNLTPFSKRVLTRSVHILSAYLDTGIIPKRIVPIEEHPLPGEIGEAAHLFLEELDKLKLKESVDKQALSNAAKNICRMQCFRIPLPRKSGC